MGLGGFLWRHGARQVYKGTGSVKDGVGDAWNDVTGKTASRDAAGAQVAATDKATQLQQEARDQALALNKPWYDTGVSALSDLAGGLKSGAFDMPEEKFAGSAPNEQFQNPGFNFNFQADPGYQFRLAEQNKSIERSAAARGGLFSGATLSDLAGRSGELASQEFGNAYGRARGAFESDRNFAYGGFRDRVGDAMTNRNFAYGAFNDQQNQRRANLQDRFSRLSTLAGLGDAATSRSGAAAGAFGQQAGDNAIGAGNAYAAGRVGGYNSQRDTLMGLGNLAVKGGALFTGGA